MQTVALYSDHHIHPTTQAFSSENMGVEIHGNVIWLSFDESANAHGVKEDIFALAVSSSQLPRPVWWNDTQVPG